MIETSNYYSVSRCAEDVEFDIEINPYHSETISFTKQDLLDMLGLYEDDPLSAIKLELRGVADTIETMLAGRSKDYHYVKSQVERLRMMEGRL